MVVFYYIILYLLFICIKDCVSQDIKFETFNSEAVKVGNPLNFTCIIDSAIPIGLISIQRNEKDIVSIRKAQTIAPVINTDNFYLSTTFIPPDTKQFKFSVQRQATVTDSGNYRCQFINAEFDTKKSDIVKIVVGHAPSDITIEFLVNGKVVDADSFDESSTFLVNCKTSVVANTLTLYLDTAIINTVKEAISVSSKVYNMLSESSVVHGKQFKCVISNLWGSLENTSTVFIRSPPKLDSITLNDQQGPVVTVKPGGVLICQASGYPLPSVSFDPNYNTSHFTPTANTINKPNEIAVQSLKEKVDSVLTCIATNSVQRVAKTFFVTIDENAAAAGALKSSNVLIIGVVVAVVLLLLLLAVGVLVWRHRSANNAASKTNDVQYRNYQPVNSADVQGGGSSKMRDMDTDDLKGQAPAKLDRPQRSQDSAVYQPASDDELHYSTLTFYPEQKAFVGSHFPSARVASPPGAYRLPVPTKHHGQPISNGCETEYCEIVGERPSTRV